MDKNGGSNHINSKKRIIAIIIVIAMLAAMILPLVAAVSAQEPAKIHKGIRIGGVDVSGMTREQAAAALSDTVAQEKQTVIFLTGEGEGQGRKAGNGGSGGGKVRGGQSGRPHAGDHF